MPALKGAKPAFQHCNRHLESEDFSRASTRKICPKKKPRKNHEHCFSRQTRATKKPRKSRGKVTSKTSQVTKSLLIKERITDFPYNPQANLLAAQPFHCNNTGSSTCLACMEGLSSRSTIQLLAGVQTAEGIECEQKTPPTPHKARTAILAIWVWCVRQKRRKWCFSDLLLAAVLGSSHDRTAKTAKKAILAISVWRAYVLQWTANLTNLARNYRKDCKARISVNQPLAIDCRFRKCGLVIPLDLHKPH